MPCSLGYTQLLVPVVVLRGGGTHAQACVPLACVGEVLWGQPVRLVRTEAALCGGADRCVCGALIGEPAGQE